MRAIRNIIGLLFVTFCTNVYCFGAYLTDIPMQITQPNLGGQFEINMDGCFE